MEKMRKFIDEKAVYLLYVYGLACAVSISACTVILAVFLLFYVIDLRESVKRTPKEFALFALFYLWKMLTLIFNGLFSSLGEIINIWDKTPYFTASKLKVKKDQIEIFFKILLWANSIIILYALGEKYLHFPVLLKPLFTPDMVRFKGYFSHPLRFAGYISIVALISFNLAVFYSRKFLKFVPILILGVFLTGSRSYFISVVAATLVVSYFKSKKFFSIYSVSIVLYCALIMAVMPQIRNRVETSFDKGVNAESSASLRMNFWRAGIEIFETKPVFGVGDGQLSPYLQPYKDRGLLDNTAHAHNSYITTAAESGIIGLGIYLWLLFFFLKKYFLIGKNSGAPFSKAFAFSLFSAFLNLSLAGIFESHFSTFIIWSFLTVLMGLHHSYEKEGVS